MNGKTNNSAFGRVLSVVKERGRKISILDAQTETDGQAYNYLYQENGHRYAEDMDKKAMELLEDLKSSLNAHANCLRNNDHDLPSIKFDYPNLYQECGMIVSATKLIASSFFHYADYLNCSIRRNSCDVTVCAMMCLATLQLAGTKYNLPDEQVGPCCDKALRFEELLIENFQKGPSLTDLDFQPWRLEDINNLYRLVCQCFYS